MSQPRRDRLVFCRKSPPDLVAEKPVRKMRACLRCAGLSPIARVHTVMQRENYDSTAPDALVNANRNPCVITFAETERNGKVTGIACRISTIAALARLDILLRCSNHRARCL